jgi:hypothetical protein
MKLLVFLRRRSAAPMVCLSAAAAVLALSTLVRGADGGGAPLKLPRGPARPGFDVSRFDSSVYGAFEPFDVTRTRPLRDALKSRLVAEDTDVLMTDTTDGPVALLVEQMAYHHLAQGGTLGQDWLVSFCVVCNTGTRLTPLLDGRPARFEAAGVYEGMLVMRDTTSGTLWNHITGEALYGPRVGTTLGPIGNVLQMTVKQALAAEPDTRIAISDRIYFAGGQRHGTLEGLSLLGRRHARPAAAAEISPVFAATLGREDTRRPRMDLGLGVWSGTEHRYYPRELLQRMGNALMDGFDGRQLLVYLDRDTATPAAIFVNSSHARVDGSTVRLDNQIVLRNGVLVDSRGQRLATERPLQVFTRWYGFALTFPGTEVYGQE